MNFQDEDETTLMCVQLTNHTTVMGMVDPKFGMIDLVGIYDPYIVETMGENIGLSKYNIFGKIDEPVMFLKDHVISIYECSDKIKKFYDMFVASRKTMSAIRDDIHVKEDLEQYPETEASIVDKMASEIIKPTRLDIEELRNSVSKLLVDISEDGDN